MKTHSMITPQRVSHSIRARFNPIRNLTPDTLSGMLDAFQRGELRRAALTWEAMERRDDVLQGVAAKRKKAVARLPWEITTHSDSPEAAQQKAVLEKLYQNLSTGHATDASVQGSLPLLIKQMMDATGKGYAVHEIIWDLENPERPAISLRFVPLWFFENRSGRLRFLKSESAQEGRDLDPGGWLITHGEGLMESCSIAWLFKHLPLRDWLIYCERNGMPGVKGTTDAPAGTPDWEAARTAVADFGAEFHALINRGTDIEAIDLSTRGTLPYPALVERMDRAMAALWRGVDLATLSRSQGVGASLQQEELSMIEADDAARISEALHTQIDRPLLRHLFPNTPVEATFRLKPRDRGDRLALAKLYSELKSIGLPLSKTEIRKALNLAHPGPEDTL